MKKYLKIISAAIMVISGVIFGATIVSAQPSIFFAPTKTAAATTTLAWITPGTGTTTLAIPSPFSLGMTTKYNNAWVLFQATATNTPPNSKLEMRVEYSFDNIDWYSEGVASSSVNVTGLMQNEYSFNIATSTNYVGSSTINRLNGSLLISTPTPYVRVVFFSPIGGSNLSLWAAVQPTKEIQVLNQ